MTALERNLTTQGFIRFRCDRPLRKLKRQRAPANVAMQRNVPKLLLGIFGSPRTMECKFRRRGRERPLAGRKVGNPDACPGTRSTHLTRFPRPEYRDAPRGRRVLSRPIAPATHSHTGGIPRILYPGTRKTWPRLFLPCHLPPRQLTYQFLFPSHFLQDTPRDYFLIIAFCRVWQLHIPASSHLYFPILRTTDSTRPLQKARAESHLLPH